MLSNLINRLLLLSLKACIETADAVIILQVTALKHVVTPIILSLYSPYVLMVQCPLGKHGISQSMH